MTAPIEAPPPTFRHLINTRPRADTCPTCRHIVITARTRGWPTTADPQPLNNLGEAAALLAGRATFNLHHDRLTRRDHFRIAGNRQPRGTVIATHRCGHTAPPQHRDPTITVDSKRLEAAAIALCVHTLGAQVLGVDESPPF